MVRKRWLGLFGMGAGTVCLGFFFASQVVHWNKEEVHYYPLGLEPAAPTGRPSIQEPLEFDMNLDKTEWRIGVTKLRRRMAAAARGHVLEVAVGTGRNLEFYDWEGIVNADAEGKEKEPPPPQEQKEIEEAKRKRLIERLKKVNFDRSRLDEVPDTDDDDNAGIRSYTGLDISPIMLDVMLRSMRQVVPHLADPDAEVLPKRPVFNQLASKNQSGDGDCVSLLDDRIRVLKWDVQSDLPPPAAATAQRNGGSGGGVETKYDTIVQTFGLCSVRDPVGLVVNLAQAVRPDTGRIMLLEHGRNNWWGLVDGLLDRSARGHFERFGCWWNRDIELIVREAARSVPGLQIVRLNRRFFTLGTHIEVELRLDPKAQAEAAAAAAAVASAHKAGEEQYPKQSGGWFGSMFGSGSAASAEKEPSESKEQGS